MEPLRKEIKDFSCSCEHLLAAVASSGSTPFTRHETDYIEYYAREMTQLVDELLSKSGPQARHKRHAIQEYAAACETLLLSDVLSEDESDSVRQSISDVITRVLVEKEDPPAGPVRLTSA